MKTSHKLLFGLLLAAITIGCCYWAFHMFDPGKVWYLLMLLAMIVAIVTIGVFAFSDQEGGEWFMSYLWLMIFTGMVVFLILTNETYKIRDTSTGKVLYVAGRPFSDSTYLKITKLNDIRTDCKAHRRDSLQNLYSSSDFLLLHITANKFDWVDKNDIPTAKICKVDCDSMRIETAQKSYMGQLVGDIEVIRCYKNGESWLVTFENGAFSPEMKYKEEEEITEIPYW